MSYLLTLQLVALFSCSSNVDRPTAVEKKKDERKREKKTGVGEAKRLLRGFLGAHNIFMVYAIISLA